MTRPPFRLGLLAFLFLNLLAGCQSERAAFRFAPPSRAVAIAPLAAASPAAAALPSEATTPIVVVPPASRAAKPARRANPARFPAAGTARVPRQQLSKLNRRLATIVPARRPAAAAKQARPAESGLKGIFFFFLGVTLVVLAGLAAGVAAIAGISFWLALGFVAAGLVVLGLLYALFKKK